MMDIIPGAAGMSLWYTSKSRSSCRSDIKSFGLGLSQLGSIPSIFSRMMSALLKQFWFWAFFLFPWGLDCLRPLRYFCPHPFVLSHKLKPVEPSPCFAYRSQNYLQKISIEVFSLYGIYWQFLFSEGLRTYRISCVFFFLLLLLSFACFLLITPHIC